MLTIPVETQVWYAGCALSNFVSIIARGGKTVAIS